MSVAAPEATTTAPGSPLNRGDRCDRCGAEAFVRVSFTQGDLLFCGHHFTKYEHPLREQGVLVHDERDKINPKPSISANAA